MWSFGMGIKFYIMYFICSIFWTHGFICMTLQSMFFSFGSAAVGTLFTININLILSCSCWNIFCHQFLARLTLPLLGYYLPFIINLYSCVISEFWCFLIMNMEDGEGGAWSVPLLFYTERKWSCAYFLLFTYWRWFKYLHSCRKTVSILYIASFNAR